MKWLGVIGGIGIALVALSLLGLTAIDLVVWL